MSLKIIFVLVSVTQLPPQRVGGIVTLMRKNMGKSKSHNGHRLVGHVLVHCVL